MRCFTCTTDKPEIDFYPSTPRRCKDCCRDANLRSRNKYIAERRAQDRERAKLPHRIANRERVTREYYEKHPNRLIANNAANNAIRAGLLKKQPCWVCGEKAVAHHPDYDRPLDVVWLCQGHHKAAHALVKLAA